MSSVWFRHFRYVFVAYVHVFLSQVECCFVSWLSPWFCLLRRSGSCHSYHIALPRHGMFVSYDEIGEVLILLVCLRLSGQVPWDHLLSKHVFLRPITAWLTMALQELHEYAHAIQSGNVQSSESNVCEMRLKKVASETPLGRCIFKTFTKCRF